MRTSKILFCGLFMSFQHVMSVHSTFIDGLFSLEAEMTGKFSVFRL